MWLSPAQIKVMGGPGCINEGGVIPFMNVFFNRRNENEKNRNNNLLDRGSGFVFGSNYEHQGSGWETHWNEAL